jgi:diadenosine tetraphosphatase ApaH/serine/threonine PP2A family protein phosphatase
LLNPGSVGQARDGDPTAGYLVLDSEAERATWHRVPYDIAAVQGAMRAVRLPARLSERLSYGI